MPHWKGTGLSGAKTIQLEETLGVPLGGNSGSDDGSFLCVYSGASTGTDPGSDRSLGVELDAQDEGSGAGYATYLPISGGSSGLSFDLPGSMSGSFTFRVKALGAGAQLRVNWFGTTSLGEAYTLEVTLTRLPQPVQPFPHVIP